MTVKWHGVEKRERIRRGALRGLATGIGIVESRAVALIMGPPKSGRISYRRGVRHQASARGEAPANDIGRLVNSRRIEIFTDQMRARLIFSTNYAWFLEIGTAKMEPRPYARRALMETRIEVTDAVYRGILAELK